MPPRASGFGERQRLLSPPMADPAPPEPADENGQLQQHPQRQHPRIIGFWQAVQRRRETSDLQAGATASSPRQPRNKWAALGFGQVIAFIAASVNVTSFTLENSLGVVAPSFQLFLMYIFLTMHLCFRSPHRPSSQPVVRTEDDDDGDNDDNVIPLQPPPIHEYRIPLFCCLRLRIPWYLYFFISCVDVGAVPRSGSNVSVCPPPRNQPP